ncbi:hypothetical protein [Saccharothrix sp. NRRL B-16314]|uniref:hypothetical protein n=1 Tax=Saccharothrix sp. NRRL B-16314 TaxID=1463825 RepID=UPI000526FD94|nr:hypothetical protein [Saccharothrix sp. NRRL B-16314]
MLFAAEAAVSLAAAGLMVLLARGVDVNPLDRIGQISGLAALQLRYALIAAILLVLAVVTARIRWAAHAPLVRRLAAAAAAGLFSGLVAGAVVIALRGTSWGLNAVYGDSGNLIRWTHGLIQTGSFTADYPPGWLHALAWYSQLTDTPPEYSLRILQIVGTALFGPIAYLSWRLMLTPLWALVLGVIPAVALVDPYKPYTNIMLVALIPLLLTLLRRLRRAADTPWRTIVLHGVGIGAALGVVFLIYSGWFVWSAPGVFLAAIVLFPWRTGWRKGLALVAITAAVFVAIAHRHLFGMLRASGSVKDRFFYWDTWVEPTYIAMWRGDLPGANPGPWPPPGELGGVGLFTVLALVGLAAAIAVARTSTVVITLTAVFGGAWLLRFYFGAQMYAADAVQLYPRSTVELFYCLLLLTGFAGYFGLRRVQGITRVRTALASPSLALGVLTALFLFLASSGSSIGDRFMPRTDNSPGSLSLHAQLIELLDGSCPAYAATLGGCFDHDDPRLHELVNELRDRGPKPGELPHPPTGH